MQKQIWFSLLIAMFCVMSVHALTNQNTDAILNLVNQNPTIINITGITAQDPIENGITNIILNFTAEDLDGNANINVSTALGSFFKSGESTRSSSCNNITAINGNKTVFTCTISMQYYDAPGVWGINASVQDINLATAYNDTTTFTYNTLKAFVMSPNLINFGTLHLNDQKKEALNHTLINNTGNVAISSGGINVTGYDLFGQTDASKSINVSQFSVNLTTGVGTGDVLVNDTQVPVTGGALPRGAPGLNQLSLYWFVNVPSFGLTAQSYATTGHTAWVIKV
jgi:hypothetical protein